MNNPIETLQPADDKEDVKPMTVQELKEKDIKSGTCIIEAFVLWKSASAPRGIQPRTLLYQPCGNYIIIGDEKVDCKGELTSDRMSVVVENVDRYVIKKKYRFELKLQFHTSVYGEVISLGEING